MYFKVSHNNFQKHFLVLDDLDIMCFYSEKKERLKFIHSLVGTQISMLYHHEQSSLVRSGYLFKFELKISETFKRVFYFEERHQVEAWTKKLKEVSGFRNVSDFYEITQILGEGSFGRVFRAKIKRQGLRRYVAIKQIEKENLD